jgi:hypothetical protein
MFLFLFFLVLVIISFIVSFIESFKNLFKETNNSFVMVISIIVGMFLGYIFLY